MTVPEEIPPSKIGNSSANAAEQNHFITDSLRSSEAPSTGNILDDCDSGTSSFLSEDAFNESNQDLAVPFSSSQPLHTEIGLHKTSDKYIEQLEETAENDDCWKNDERLEEIWAWGTKILENLEGNQYYKI